MLQPGVLSFGAFQDRNVGICFLPKHEESLIASFRLGLISRQSVHSTELQVGQRADGIQAHEPAMIENLLKLDRSFPIPARGSQSLAAHIGRVQTAKIKMINASSPTGFSRE